MSEKCFIAIMAFIGLIIIVANFKPEYKYQIVTSNGTTLLLDKEKGYVWHNTAIDNKIKVPIWEYMTYSGKVVPDGEEEIRKQEFERIKKQSGIK
jgi:hypothetical protein